MRNTELLLDDGQILGENIDWNKVDLSKVKFKGKNAGLAWKLEQAKDQINRARWILAAIAGFQLIGLITVLTSNIPVSGLVKGAYIVIIAGFLIAALITPKFPVITLGVSFLFYLLYALLSTAVAISTTGGPRGVVWLVVILAFLGVGLYYAISSQKIKKQLIAALQQQQGETTDTV